MLKEQTMKIVAGKVYTVKIPEIADEPAREIRGYAYWYAKISKGTYKRIMDGSIKEFTMEEEYPDDVVMISTDDADWECSVSWIVPE